MFFKNQKFILARFAVILAYLAGMIGLTPVRPAHATTLTVTNINDSGPGSLRQSVLDAAPGDTIRFDPSLAGQTIALSSQVNLDKDLTIDGSGLDPAVEISGSLAARIFYVTSNRTVTLNSVLLKEGRNYSGSNGAAIYNDGALTVTNSTFINNLTTGSGGAIYSQAILNVTHSTFLSNSAHSGGAIYVAGGIFSNPNVSQTLINNTFVSNQANTVSGQGGGLLISGSQDPYGSGNNPVLANNTFSGNGAYEGGALYSWGGLRFTNNIFADSTSGGDCVTSTLGGMVSGSHNLIEDGQPCSADPFVSGDPLLGPLSDNGGPTLTMALLPGSPAIDAGTATCVPMDQRGAHRPQGAACEIGAYEYDYVSTRYYVKWDAGGLNNGASWIDAYTDLQSALAAASSGDEIWVAAGTYKPTAGTDRTVSFKLKSGVAIYGGFAGTETSWDLREVTTNVTILSGDIGLPGDHSDNSYHVLAGNQANEYARLDGFTITAGNANGSSSPNDRGGGVYNDRSSPSLSNVILSGNYATFGGGMYNGGESSYWEGSNPDLTHVTFRDNSAVEGGGMRNENYSHPRLVNATFSGNSAVRSGGGMENFNSGNPVMTNVTFDGNSSSAGGGMTNWSNSSPIMMNVTFHANSAGESGGAIHNDNGSSPWMRYATVSGNVAARGGGLYNGYASTPDLSSIILYGNHGGEIYNSSGTPGVTYSIVQGGYPGPGNLDADPLLGPLQDNGGFTRTMALSTGSPAIDAGDGFYCPSTDQRGVTRPFGSHCDIGAYEYEPDTTPPTVLSMTRANPNHTSAGSVSFTVTFSEAVTGVDTGDFTPVSTGKIAGASVSNVSGSGSVYLVTANTGSGNGTLRLDIPVTATISDLNTNPLGGLPFTGAEAYTVLKTASFSDVEPTHWAWSFIEQLYLAGITGGCSTNPPGYCPEDAVTRGQMAVFLERGIHGSSYTPPAVGASTGFGDVPTGYWSAAWIKQLAADGITSGCGSGNYCPEHSVTRAQMAVFLLRAKYGASYVPPAAENSTGFGDVPSDYWAAAWIKQLVAEGITAGCGNNNYCPEQPVTRAQMAVFLVRTFDLP